MTISHDIRATPDELLAIKSRHVMPCVKHFFRSPPHIVRGEGAALFDHDGREYLDAVAGVGVMNAGHGHPDIIEPAIEQIRTLQHTTSIFLTEPVLRLAERLAAILPVDSAQMFFCASGSEAVEFALLTATQITGRPLVIAAHDGLHGRTRWAMSVTGLPMWRTDPLPMDDRVLHVPFDDADALRRAFESHAGRIAAFIVEPVKGNGGVRECGDEFRRAARELCDRHGAMLIADEVQTGFGRTGRWFACEAWPDRPDIVCISKALGNGFPIAATAVRGDVARRCVRPAASTFGGNPVCAAAALATIDVHAREDLPAAALERGEQLAAGLRRVAAAHPSLFGRPRGVGLMRGLPVAGVPAMPGWARCDTLLESMKDLGVLAAKTGRDRDVLTFTPPLVMTAAQVDRVLAALDEAVTQLMQV